MSLTLTVAEIIDLANVAGLRLEGGQMFEDALETEYTIVPCRKDGMDDDGTIRRYRYVVYDEEYPEEGSTGLGPELKTP